MIVMGVLILGWGYLEPETLGILPRAQEERPLLGKLHVLRSGSGFKGLGFKGLGLNKSVRI